jgi:hypothetical protein
MFLSLGSRQPPKDNISGRRGDCVSGGGKTGHALTPAPPASSPIKGIRDSRTSERIQPGLLADAGRLARSTALRLLAMAPAMSRHRALFRRQSASASSEPVRLNPL